MPLNQALKGKRYDEVSLEVEREHVLRFCAAIGEDNPVFNDAGAARDAGYEEQLAPPTFLTVMQIMASAQVTKDRDLGLDYSRVVHGEQQYEWSRPVKVGESLFAVPTIADIYAKGPNEFLVIESVIRTGSGERVGVSRTTLLSRGTAGA